MAHPVRAAAFIVAALVFLNPATAAADEDDDSPAAALASGAGVMFVSLGVGASLVATGTTRSARNTGFIGASSGMMLAPIVAHAVVGETMRGVYFALPSLVPIAVNSALIARYPNIIRRAPPGVQYTTFIAFTLSIFGPGIGVVDAARVATRRTKRAASSSSSLVIAPLVGDGMAGAFAYGSF